ncbi:hypothetical protein Runsl_0651 [Runella slithyformis DSM 19594]|uniref:Uncharacterized protein n=1 Tax=Runella slithyformis (strain ATCC 29530 / DSM 19594 / LMG 11500 / NCIMB 11436 / LSU 4) TaxID=761193 RepID=A0A7U4E4A6_RUNSL|nr:hypothetical protein Runsl_0651 [Runella slithyformis DSM 19594]
MLLEKPPLYTLFSPLITNDLSFRKVHKRPRYFFTYLTAFRTTLQVFSFSELPRPITPKSAPGIGALFGVTLSIHLFCQIR